MKNTYKITVAWLLLLTYIDNRPSHAKKIEFELKSFRSNGKQYKYETIEREEDLEYPGQDGKLLKKLQEKWNNYYECLKLRQNETKKLELRRLIEGQNTVLECNICVRPFQNFEELQWHYKPLSPGTNITELEILDLTQEMELLPNKTLKLFNVVQYFEGLYVCFHGRNPVSAFILEISSNDTIERVASAYGRINKNNLLLDGVEFKIQYEWGEWSECSSCGTVGRKYRYATCFVSPKNAAETRNQMKRGSVFIHRRRLLSKEFFDLKKSLSKTKNIRTKITNIYYKIKNSTSEVEHFDWGAEIISKFSKGVPCASRYLPRAALEQVKNYTPAKAIVKLCQESCQEVEIFEVDDKYGRVIEIANNSAGIYSMFQTLPQLPPQIERVSITGELGNDIVIQCPGTSLTNTPVIWAVNQKIIFPEVIANQSNGRFEIDLVNRISLKKLRLKDSHIYSCWQKGKLVGTVHLNVEKKVALNFNHHITLFGAATVIATFLFVGAKVMTRKLNSTPKL